MQGPDYDTAVRCAGSAKATAEAHEKAKQLLADTYKNAFTLANKVSDSHFRVRGIAPMETTRSLLG